jgi:hypothetical protein
MNLICTATYILKALTSRAIVYLSRLFIDWNYRRHAKRSGLTVVSGVRQDLTNINIARVRLALISVPALPAYWFILKYGMGVRQSWVVDMRRTR